MIEARCRLAEQAGAVACAAPDDEGLAAVTAALAEMTSGRGADHVFLAAGGSSNGPVETAAKLARDRARVVDIGKTKLDLPWNAYYDKELDVRFSRSYGPGRYDDRYELDGIDYPAGYVRWTERRNLECFLDLLAQGPRGRDAGLRRLPDARRGQGLRRPVLRRAEGRRGPARVPGAGPRTPAPGRRQPGGPAPYDRPVQVPNEPTWRQGLAIGFIGAGNYASSMLLRTWPSCRTPQLATSRPPSRCRRSTPSGGSASPPRRPARRRARGRVAGRDLRRDPAHTHADLVCRALETGKAVFVEKPLALTGEELDRITEVIAKTGNDRLMVGFNRRFAPMLTKMKAAFGPASYGSVTRYLVNAGELARTAGTATTARGRGSPARAVTSWTRSAGGRTACPRRSTRSAARTPTTCRSRCGSPTAPAA
jgi:hypothetical protein